MTNKRHDFIRGMVEQWIFFKAVCITLYHDFVRASASVLFLNKQEHSVEDINISGVTKNKFVSSKIVERQGSFWDKSLSSR